VTAGTPSIKRRHEIAGQQKHWIMAEISESAVRKVLDTVIDSATGRSVAALGMVGGIVTRGGHVAITLDVDPSRGTALEPLRQACEQAVRAMPGVLSATAVMTSERPAPPPPQAPGGGHGHSHAPGGKTTGGGGRIEVPGVKHIIAVASGKGGVGKSTTAVNLALGLAANGISTGLLDADIYGPSMPRMLDVKEKPESVDGKQLKPIERYGIKTMSIGYIVAEDTPMIWRGPMVSSALEQMLRDVQWGDLDVLVVDMPPGTGDAQLTLAQRVALAGAVIVSTPQDIALVDARKGLNMFRKVAVPVLGIVENMSYFLCPKCGERSEIFGHGGAHEEADKLGVPFLGEIPLHLDIRTTSDSGHPIVVSKPESAHAQVYKNIAGRVWKQLSANQRGPRAAPRIVVQ
jgi:ATP-binding protein involved in chromosome partitioning